MVCWTKHRVRPQAAAVRHLAPRELRPNAACQQTPRSILALAMVYPPSVGALLPKKLTERCAMAASLSLVGRLLRISTTSGDSDKATPRRGRHNNSVRSPIERFVGAPWTLCRWVCHIRPRNGVVPCRCGAVA